MGRKSKPKATVQPFCFYCDREFDDEKTLIMHQKAKHFKCLLCHKKMVTTTALNTHMQQVHKEKLIKVPNAKSGRDGLEFEIYGMEGVPEEFLVSEPSMKRQRVHGVEEGTDDDDEHSANAAAAQAQGAAAATNPYASIPPGMHPYPFPPGMMMLPYGYPGMVPYGSGPPPPPVGLPSHAFPPGAFPHPFPMPPGPRPTFSIPTMPGAVPPGMPLAPGMAMSGGTGSISLAGAGGAMVMPAMLQAGAPRPPMPLLVPSLPGPASHAVPVSSSSSLPVPPAPVPSQPQDDSRAAGPAHSGSAAAFDVQATQAAASASVIPPSALAPAPPIPGQHLTWPHSHESQEEARARHARYAYNAEQREVELAALQAGLDERLAAILG